MNFIDFNFHPSIQEGVEAMGFENPTPIQESTIPLILKGNDLIACAQTGTGKTAAFVLPILSKIKNLNNADHSVKTLIIVPTRELALQIDQQIEGFAYFSGISSIAIYGGNDGGNWDRQRQAFESGSDVVIATPGRLIQHIQMGYVNFQQLQYLILDEADRMLDMGFYDDIVSIIEKLPQKRQTLMFSATMPPNIRKLAKTILVKPKEISLAVSKPADNILQAVYMVNDNEKISLLLSIISGKDYVKSVIVFASTKSEVRDIERELVRNKTNAKAIHSDLDQAEREEVLRGFKNRKFQVLVATDIISRGIDIEDIDLVVNYDVPSDPEDYIHRIGRTARAQSDGVGITFVNPKQKHLLYKIENFLGGKLFKLSYNSANP